MKTIVSIALSFLLIFAFTSCSSVGEWADNQAVTIKGQEPPEIIEQKEEIYHIEGFFDADDEEVIRHNVNNGVGYMYTPSNGIQMYIPLDSSLQEAVEHKPIVKHFVYLKGEDGKIKVFRISSECLATLIALTDKNICIDYTVTSGKRAFTGEYTVTEYSWRGFTINHVSTLPNTELPTTVHQEGKQE